MKAVLAPILVCLLSVFTGWMSGYDFNHRDNLSGLWTGLTVLAAFWLFFVIYIGEK